MAKGVPLSVRMRRGSPNSLKSLAKAGKTPMVLVLGRPRQSRTKRECEGVAELPVAGRKLSFEIGGPGVVGLGGEGVGAARVPAPDALSALGDEVVAQEDVVDGRTRREGQLGPMALEVPDDLLGPVGLVGAADPENGLHDLGRCGPRGAGGPGGAVLEAGRAFTLPSLDPFVAGGPADPVAFAEGAEAPQAVLRFGDETPTFVHDMGLPERHRSPPLRCRV